MVEPKSRVSHIPSNFVKLSLFTIDLVLIEIIGKFLHAMEPSLTFTSTISSEQIYLVLFEKWVNSKIFSSIFYLYTGDFIFIRVIIIFHTVDFKSTVRVIDIIHTVDIVLFHTGDNTIYRYS